MEREEVNKGSGIVVGNALYERTVTFRIVSLYKFNTPPVEHQISTHRRRTQ